MDKKNKEEIIIDVFSTLEGILNKYMITYVVQVCYLKIIKYFRDIYIPFKILFLYRRFNSNAYLKLLYCLYIISILLLNGSYLSLIFYYDTFVYDYIMNDRLETIMLTY